MNIFDLDVGRVSYSQWDRPSKRPRRSTSSPRVLCGEACIRVLKQGREVLTYSGVIKGIPPDLATAIDRAAPMHFDVASREEPKRCAETLIQSDGFEAVLRTYAF